jgi:hypothetical protein
MVSIDYIKNTKISVVRVGVAVNIIILDYLIKIYDKTFSCISSNIGFINLSFTKHCQLPGRPGKAPFCFGKNALSQRTSWKE